MKSRLFALAMVVICAVGWSGCAGMDPVAVEKMQDMLVIIGGKVIGKEIAQEFNKFGITQEDCEDLSTQALATVTSNVRHKVVRYVALNNKRDQLLLGDSRKLEAEPGEYVYNHETPSGEKVSGRKVKYRVIERGKVVHESEEVYVAETDSRVPLG